MTTSGMLDTISDALVTIGATIPGIRLAIDPPPPNPVSANLPLLYVLSGEATHSDGEQFVEVARTFRVQVAVMPVALGDPYTREKTCRPLVDLVTEKYRSYFRLASVNWVQRVRVLRDSGIVVLPEYGYKYIGFEVPVQVTYIAPRTFAPGE
jgi:hypothetical protein